MSSKEYQAWPLPELEFVAGLLAILAESGFNHPLIESNLKAVRAEIARRNLKKPSLGN